MAGVPVQDDGENMPTAMMRAPADLIDFEGTKLPLLEIQRIQEVRGIAADLRSRLDDLSNINSVEDLRVFQKVLEHKIRYLETTGKALD